MRPPDLDAGLCRKFSPEELDSTFNFSATDPRLFPSAAAQAAWDEAKEICIECPVFLLCRESCWGQEFGVVGGTDEHERYLYRRRLSKELAAKDKDERAKLAAHLHARHAGGLGDSVATMARATGYSELAVKTLMAEHEEREQPKPQPVTAASEPDAPKGVPDFPERNPSRTDGWVWYRSRMMAGHYVAQTSDGLYMYMKIKCSGSQTAKWFPAGHVSLRTAVVPVVRTWVGRPDDVQEAA